MNELKPEDVREALEICAEYENDPCPEHCPLYEENICNMPIFLNILREKDADIKRRDAKIDTLQKQVRQYGAEIGRKDAEIERLKKHQESVATVCNRANEHYNDLYEQAKEILKAEARAEAITEFEKKLMEKKCHYTETEHTFDFDGVTVEDIEQTAKELKGAPDEL